MSLLNSVRVNLLTVEVGKLRGYLDFHGYLMLSVGSDHMPDLTWVSLRGLSAHLSLTPLSGTACQWMESGTVGVCTPGKSADITNQCFVLFVCFPVSQLLNIHQSNTGLSNPLPFSASYPACVFWHEDQSCWRNYLISCFILLTLNWT